MNPNLNPPFQCLGALSGPRILPVPSNSRECGSTSARDLYSLGVTLWKMLTGLTPFRGTSAELMHQHLHAPLPLGLLEAVRLGAHRFQ
jgi:serine/threonine protein kinase